MTEPGGGREESVREGGKGEWKEEESWPWRQGLLEGVVLLRCGRAGPRLLLRCAVTGTCCCC